MKYGIWRTRYTRLIKNTFEGWLFINGQPLIFESEIQALNELKRLEKMIYDANIKHEVKKYCEVVK